MCQGGVYWSGVYWGVLGWCGMGCGELCGCGVVWARGVR